MLAETVPVQRWTLFSAIAFASSLSISFILKSEIQNRRQASTTFTTKSLKCISILCIICSLLAELFYAIYTFPGICKFAGFMCASFTLCAMVSMELYQLFRLQYCFSNSQIHSNYGYPKHLFIFMYSCIILMTISSVLNYAL